ncbi:peptidase M48, Ste24p [Candidatus Ruthia magnifica str. Cm (Calyptogena magnifica)]|uniref:Peptidase M48, Ste24p n=2 Tax=Candidatus Ruthturnera TaxID=1541743 RepID=A1AW59_RUTMC|nr:peptidase M48, Ste24p [Candidatus Ruthia magnifica str. Cm (Calyptogena magnifica)]
MDFREHQDKAKKNTIIIWSLYLILLLISSMLIGYTLFIGLNLAQFYQPEYQQYSFNEKFIAANQIVFQNQEQLLGFLEFSLMVLLAMLSATAFGFYQKSNGHKVALAFGGKLISDEDKLSIEEKQTLNIVAEQALAANIPAPALYIIPDNAINAFAAGKTTQEAIVAITQGSMVSFNRTQLSGVIAHEIGHIVNHDIKLNIQISAFVFGFTALFFLARMIFYQAAYNRRMDGRAKLILFAIAAIIALIGMMTVWFGRILQAAMSRQREYLADASAVQFTRYPNGLVEAFEIMQNSGNSGKTKLENPNTEEYTHAMLFGMSGELFATHPPLDKRIKRIQNRI